MHCTKNAIAAAVVAVLLMSLGGVEAQGAGEGDRVLPLGRSLAAGEDLPLPFGLGVTVYYQRQDYDLDSLDLQSPSPMINGFIQGILATDPYVEIESELVETHATFDVWVLPFLNLFAMVGYVDGETVVNVDALPDPLKIKFDGPVYGGGCTLAYGVGPVFASITGARTEADLDTSDGSISTWVVTPEVGVRLFEEAEAFDLAVYVGALYQNTEETHEGDYNVPGFGRLDYDVTLQEEEPWNGLAGVDVTVAEHVTVGLQAGFGPRRHVSGTVAYRF